jgi:3-oxoacyl-[acyl-carrier protein] reductase
MKRGDQMFKNKVIVITGGTSGIGLETAKKFVSEDAEVVIIGRNEDKLKKVERELNFKTLSIVADLRDLEQIHRAVELIIRKFNRIDALINNAGTGAVPAITTKTPLEKAVHYWNEEIAIHLTGSFLMSMAAAPYIARPNGRIVNISSIAAYTGGRRAGAIGYSASKAGLIGLTHSLARELSSEGITVNAVAPGFIENTGFTGSWPAEVTQSIISQIPAGRAGNVNDVASTILHLCSPMASYITGQVIHVSGGWLFSN